MVSTDGAARSPLQLLLVEDNTADTRLFEEVLREGPYAFRLNVVRDGASALRYMRQEAEYSHASRPDLVLLDLNLPGMDGRTVLAEVRSDPTLNGIPVIIFTGSPLDEDVLFAFNFRAEGFLRKPVRVAEFRALVERLGV
jgi:two-component system, chemotaxis family, response regulator Rcp1